MHMYPQSRPRISRYPVYMHSMRACRGESRPLPPNSNVPIPFLPQKPLVPCPACWCLPLSPLRSWPRNPVPHLHIISTVL